MRSREKDELKADPWRAGELSLSSIRCVPKESDEIGSSAYEAFEDLHVFCV